MNELVIGADGFIGAALQRMSGARGTSRRNPTLLPNDYYLDLLNFTAQDLPPADIVYLCAGVNGAKSCEGNQESYRVNVDATIRIARHYKECGSFVVWISSTTVEWSATDYARQKALSEIGLSLLGAGIVRAGRVLQSNVYGLCQTMLQVGRDGVQGVTLWGVDEKPYEK